jgi:hypothetical protein
VANGTAMTAFSAPGVQSVGLGSSSPSNQNSLSMLNNAVLATVDFPSLEAIGGSLVIANNSALSDINGFPALASVGGNVDLTGDFDSVSLPALDRVGGGVNIQSSNPDFQCPSSISSDRTNGVINGKGFVCVGDIKNPAEGITGANYSANTFLPFQTSAGTVGFQSGIGMDLTDSDRRFRLGGEGVWDFVVLLYYDDLR